MKIKNPVDPINTLRKLAKGRRIEISIEPRSVGVIIYGNPHKYFHSNMALVSGCARSMNAAIRRVIKKLEKG